MTPIERAELDGYYYQHISLCLDIKIFVVTVLQSLGFKKNKPSNEQEGK